MPAPQTGKKTAPDAILEKQLEKLFSDAVLPDCTAATAQRPTQPGSDTPPPTPPSPVVQVADPASPKHRSRPDRPSMSRWTTVSLSTAVISVTTLVLMSAVMLIKQGWAAESDVVPPRSGHPVTAVAEQVFPATTPEASRVTSLPSATALTKSTPVAKVTAITRSTAYNAGLVPTNTKIVPPATATLTTDAASPTSTDVPATDTPTADTATPTLAPVQSVYRATATPVPAWSIGLNDIPTPAPSVPMPNDVINIVLLGSDQRPHETFWRTDVIIVVSLDPDLPSVSMLSIPRDTWLYIPNWTFQRINLADTHGYEVGYPGGGPGLVKAAIEYNFGIHVDYYARVDFAGLMRIVDTLGGIDVLLDCPVEDGFPDDPITEDPSIVTQISYPEPGLYHLDGKHALWLARSRKTTSEFARSRRQHRILQGIWAKANELGFVARLPDLWEDLTATVQTDLNLDDVLWLASVGLQLEPGQIRSSFIDGRYLTAWVTPGGGNVLLPHTEAVLEAMEQHFNPYPYKAPQGFSQVEVWNGSGHEDWGILAADELLRNGFDVTDIRQTGELYESTQIIDFTTSSKGSPLPLLERLFDSASIHVSTEPGAKTGVSFRLIVAADYQPCKWPTPAQWSPTPTPSGIATGNQ